MKINRIITFLALTVCTLCAQAFSLSVYADSSRLSTGRWYRVSVSESGVYALRPSTLRRMGFSDPSKVRVFGYGASRIPDVLSASTYTDDLPQAPMTRDSDGSVIFFAQGPESWTASTSKYFTRRSNIYTNSGYYYITDSQGGDIDEIPVTATPGAQSPATTFCERVHHEQDLTSPGEAGAELVGEDFRFTPTRSFSFRMPGRVPDTDVWFETSFVCRILGSTSRLVFTANGVQVPAASTDVVAITANDVHVHGTETVTRHTLGIADGTAVSGTDLDITLTHSRSGTVYGAWLNYMCVNYTRNLTLADDRSGSLLFCTSGRSLSLDGAGSDTRIWDVTSGSPVRQVDYSLEGSRAEWTSVYAGDRRYVAFGRAATLPEPKLEGVVANQNLHAHGAVDMVIICPAQWKAQAERIARMHADEGMSVRVVDPEEIYNEFSSGSPDVSGLRKYLKMVYDRGDADTQLQYCLLMARGTCDNRHNTAALAKSAPTLPAWYGNSMRESLNDSDGFGTDDFIAMLEDGSGANKGIDILSIAVGRIPSTSAASAKNYVDKLLEYHKGKPLSGWENKVMLLADDEDGGDHVTQSDRMEENMMAIPGQPMMVNKVYIDAYTKQNGEYPKAREEMFRYLDEGTAWWTFVGHANNHSWTADGQLTYYDINNMLLKHIPVLFAGTCDFLRWDSATESGGEILMNERYGGTITTISATRPVWIYENGLFTAALGRNLGNRDSEGRLLTPGQIYRNAKNDIRSTNGTHVSSTNRLRFVFMGDPALRLPTPDLLVRLDAVDGVPARLDGDSEPATLMALRQSVLSGSVTDAAGNVLEDFNGTVTATLYDADRTVVTNGNGEDGVQLPITMHGSKLFAGSATVTDGRFEMKVTVPAEIDNNYRPATVSMYATASAHGADSISARRAIGVSRQFYIYGIDEDAEPDTIAPVIDRMYLNTPDFRNGDKVNTSPMLVARVSDDRSINLSEGSLGGRMVAILDNSKRYTDVSLYYTPSGDGTASGTINYPFEDLQPGAHTLKLRVWDANNNVAEGIIDFSVGADVPVQSFRLYCDANPASVEANFYVEHDRPDQRLNVTVTVYDLMGRAIWSDSVTGVSDMMRSTPVTWNLCDSSGRRVPRGIYIYRATVSEPGGTPTDSGAKRIAVTD